MSKVFKNEIRVILLILATALLYFSLCSCGISEDELLPSALPPQLQYNDAKYTRSGDVSALEKAAEQAQMATDLVEVGQIESYSYRINENFQCNESSLVNCKLYLSASIPGFIFVLDEDILLPYQLIKN